MSSIRESLNFSLIAGGIFFICATVGAILDWFKKNECPECGHKHR